ncbi:MAG: ABC transporter permease [Candidatus Syntrophoarchaeum sp.]|nr:ABC transporter permease [Candidatus Syntrophoarchaeum sp.]
MFLKLARRNLSRHRFRSILAIVGIIIGVIAISSLGILGNSIKLSVTDSFGDIGNEIIVYPDYESGWSNLTKKEFNAIRKTTGVDVTIPVSQSSSQIQFGKDSTFTTVYGVDAIDMKALLELSSGQFQSGSRCVIGGVLADSFDLKHGDTVNLEGSSFKISGILKKQGMRFDISADRAIFITPKSYSSLYENEDYAMIIVKTQGVEEVEAVKERIEANLNKRKDRVMVFGMDMILESLDEFFGMLSKFLMGIGAISLIVAGVSILNVMLISTVERTKEIGVMRAIGSSRRDILILFILEATILGVIGGLIGGVLSFGGGYLVNIIILKKASYLFAPSSIVYIFIGVLFGVVTGVLGGLYPAWKASRMLPLTALKTE